MGVILTKLLTAMILQVPLWGQVVGALFLHLSRRSREDPHCYWGTAFFWKVNDLKETKVKVICFDKSWRVKKIGMIFLVLVSWFLFLCCYVGCIRCYVCGITIVHKYMRFRWNCFFGKAKKNKLQILWGAKTAQGGTFQDGHLFKMVSQKAVELLEVPYGGYIPALREELSDWSSKD